MYTIRQKQTITDKIKDVNAFARDLELFQRKFPRSPMNRELARVNNVNREGLCGRMVYALLDVCTEDEILKNRKSVQVEVNASEGQKAVVVSASEQVVAKNGKKKDKKRKSSRK